MATNIDLALEDEKKAFKAYLTTKNVSEKSANVAVSKAFGIWKLKDKETFDKLMRSENFEKDAKALLVEIYNGSEKKAAAYYSELKRYYIYYLEKNGLPVPSEIKNPKPGRKPGTASKKKATRKTAAKKTTAKKAAEKTEKKATVKKAAAKKTTAKKAVAAKKTTAKKTVKAAATKTAALKRGRKPAAAKASAAKKTAVKKTAGRKAAVRTTAKKSAARSVSSSSNAALVKAINELNKTLAPIAKLAQKLK
ncbi:MAG: hypothetical protein ILP08_01960 [Lachnospiraceae bacterium]|nr:hypothetical protein [Lachnospiraceae bacterium]